MALAFLSWSLVMRVAYDSVIPPNTAIEFFELHYWDSDSRRIEYEKRNYRYKGETDFALHTIVEKYFLSKYKEQSVFVKLVIHEDDLTEYFEIDRGKIQARARIHSRS